MFTVKQLARLAGITPRTLHYYDEIGLLEPSRVGENGYRYYGEEALLRLQQILLYRALDMPLEDIRTILARPDFNLLPALEGHRQQLRRRIARLEGLAATVEDTILHLTGKKTMTQQQLFKAFSEQEQARYELEAAQKYDPETVHSANKKWKSYSPAEKERILAEGNAIYTDMVLALPKGPASPEAQARVERWRRHIEYFWTPALEQLVPLAELYSQDPGFRANFDKIHPALADFMLQAVTAYVAART